jgi:hypothetical protein
VAAKQQRRMARKSRSSARRASSSGRSSEAQTASTATTPAASTSESLVVPENWDDLTSAESGTVYETIGAEHYRKRKAFTPK